MKLALSIISVLLLTFSPAKTDIVRADRPPGRAVRASTAELSEPALHGSIMGSEFHIAEGDRAYVSGDLLITASRDITIDGDLLARDRGTGSESLHGIDITLVAGRCIRITGYVGAGNGMDADKKALSAFGIGYRGGRGGHLRLDAPVIVVDGFVVAGKGGQSGPNVNGSSGGDLSFRGRAVTTKHDHEIRGFAGDGGEVCQSIRHDIPAGAGGDGGKASTEDGEPIFDEDVTRIAREREAGVQNPGSEFFSPFDCPPGADGTDGISSSCGEGATGAPGNNGTQQSPQGQTGGTGGQGISASGASQANSGTVGLVGADCCPGTGGKGGQGGDAGWIVGGRGGTGGVGGNGWWDVSIPGYGGPGGTGGTGGPGGGSYTGAAGTGGNGGKATGDPGSGGAGKIGLRSPGGFGGPGGEGYGGLGGTGGTGNQGDPATTLPGNSGLKGGACPH